jgi:hypothetical protein
VVEGSQCNGAFMENQTGFDLNEAVATWRGGLAAHETIGPDQLRELESHLREAVAGFREKGLTEEEAFLVAARRIGPGQKVADEYHQGDPNALIRTRVFWMLMGVAGILFLAEVSRALMTVISMVSAFVLSPGEFYLWDTSEVMGFVNSEWIRERMIFLEVPMTTQLYGAIALAGVMYFCALQSFKRHGVWQRRCSRMMRSRKRLAITIGLMLVGTSLFSHLLQTAWDQLLLYGFNYRFKLPATVNYFGFLLSPMLIWILVTVAAPKHLISKKAKE